MILITTTTTTKKNKSSYGLSFLCFATMGGLLLFRGCSGFCRRARDQRKGTVNEITSMPLKETELWSGKKHPSHPPRW